MILRYYSIITLFFITSYEVIISQSNVDGQLMSKRYNEIAFLTTHNSYNNKEENFKFPNQDFPVVRQLVDGVRGFMIDVYEDDNNLVVYHGFPQLGKKSLQYFLSQIADFLDNNPNEIITIILECYTNANKIEAALKTAGLYDYLFTKSPDNQWPTIREMVDAGTRLVLFSDKNDSGSNQKWYHYVWKHAVETAFSVTDKSEFNWKFNRGKASNELFILNHFVTTKTFGTGSRKDSKEVNKKEFLSERLTASKEQAGKYPNYVVVDFYNLGDCISTINEFNNISPFELNIDEQKDVLKIYPNPASDFIKVEIPQTAIPPFYLSIISLEGRKIAEMKTWDHYLNITVNMFAKGMYLLHCRDVIKRQFNLMFFVGAHN